ncbi:MAG TPA: hypothetical protein VF038_09770 [Usitatibacter sp.]|jgi:hypothetical protein
MTFSAFRFAFALLVGIAAALPCGAESFASSASSAGSASVGSLSDSIRDSSGSSTHTVAEGDYRIIDVAAAEQPETLRLKMQHVADAGDDGAVIYLDVPRAALGDRAAAVGDIVGVRQRPYGYQFAWADTGVAFFLVLAADWQRDLEPRPVQL